MDNIWAIVCGQPRITYDFYNELALLCEYRKRGTICEIIYSTWYGEIDSPLKKKLDALGIFVVETPPLEDVFNKDHMCTIRQAAQVHAALRVVPKESFVLRCRTDLSNFETLRLIHYVEKLDINSFKTASFGKFTTGVKYRTAVKRFGIDMIFGFEDLCWFGFKEDIVNMYFAEDTILSFGYSIINDKWLFAGRYVHKYKIIEDYFKLIDQNGSFQKSMNNLIKNDEEFYLPSLLNKIYALYFVIIYCDFDCFYQNHVGFVPEENNVYLEDLFYGNYSAGLWKGTEIVETRYWNVIRKLIQGEFVHTVGYLNLLEYINRIKEGDLDALSILDEDIVEFEEWSLKYFIEPFKVNNNELRVAISGQNKMLGFEDGINILYSDYNLDDSEVDSLKDVSFGKEGYYSNTYKYLPFYEEKNCELYKKALFSLERYCDTDVLSRIVFMLVNKKLSKEEVEEAEFVFKRLGTTDYMMKMPMDGRRIAMLMDYIRYEAASGKKDIGEEFFNRICSFFQIEPVFSDGNTVQKIEYVFTLLMNRRYEDMNFEQKEMILQIAELEEKSK